MLRATPVCSYISTAKSAPELRRFAHFDLEMCFVLQRSALFQHLNFSGADAFLHFDLEMCFALQRCALFHHQNFQKFSKPAVFLPLWLGNLLRATAACSFCTSQLPKVLRAWSVWPCWLLLRATMACNFSCLIWPDGPASAALASLLFKPPELQNIGKTHCFATFLPFRALWSCFYWLFLFWLFLFTDSSHLCFSISPYCREFDF